MTESKTTGTQKKVTALIALLSLAGAAVSAWQTSQFFSVRSGMGAMHAICDINILK